MQRRASILGVALYLVTLGLAIPTQSQQIRIDTYAPAPLRFRPDGTLHISVFNDFHYGEGQNNPPSMGWGPISDRKTTTVVNTILDSERPDLAVLNGDLITGENTYAHNATLYLDQVVDPFVRRNTRWAITYGNHDADRNLSPIDLFQREKSMWPALSMTQRQVLGDPDEVGISNYFIPVYGSNSNGQGAPVLILWFFDSRGGVKRDGTGRRDFVGERVVSWFKAQRDALNKQYGRVIPSLAFVHIPVEIISRFQSQDGGIDPSTEPGINDDSPAAAQSLDRGRLTGEGTPFVRALIETKGLMAVFSGHDHGNDWCHRWASSQVVSDIRGSDITFCFGGHTGYGGYGKWLRGSRTVLLSEGKLGREFETWMRKEDRSISGKITVDGKYGVQRYPIVQKHFSP